MTYPSRQFSQGLVPGVLGFGLAVCLAGAAFAQAGQPRLRVTLKADKDEYTVGEEINLTLTLSNNTDAPIRMLHPECAGVSEVKVIDAENRPAYPRSAGPSPEPAEAVVTIPGRSQWAYVYPNMRWFAEDGGREFTAEAGLKASIYRIFVTLKNPDAAAGQKESGVWDTPLRSNVILLKVFPPGEKTLSCPECAAARKE